MTCDWVIYSSRSILSGRAGGRDKTGLNERHTHMRTYTLLPPQSTSTACSHQSGSRHSNGALTLALTIPWLFPLQIIWQPLCTCLLSPYLSFLLSVSCSVLSRPHFKTDLVAGRIHDLCVPRVLIAVLWWLSLTHWVTYLPNISLCFSLSCCSSRLLVLCVLKIGSSPAECKTLPRLVWTVYIMCVFVIQGVSQIWRMTHPIIY